MPGSYFTGDFVPALRLTWAVRRTSPLPSLLLVLLGACRLPPASVELETEPAAPAQADHDAPAPARSYALLPWGAALYARADFEAPSVELGAPLTTTVEGRVVEIVDRSQTGWWLVRTLGPRDCVALDLAADHGLEVFELIGWTPVIPHRELELDASAEGRSASEPDAAQARGGVEPDGAVQIVMPGEPVYWPDGTQAGEVTHPHLFYSAGQLIHEPTNNIELVCHPRRTAAGVGVLVGLLCHARGDGQLPTDLRQPVALDERRTQRGSHVARVRQGSATVSAGLDRDIVRRIVRAHVNELRHCYQAGLERDPTLAGQLEVQFEITAVGGVSAATVTSTTLSDPNVGACFSRAIVKWKFPKPQGGVTVTVDYPFDLSP